MKSNKTFGECITKLDKLQKQLLANVMEVALSTVNKWEKGTATPHPTIETQIKQWVERLIERKDYGCCCQVYCGDCGGCPCCSSQL